ncbi:hypothetical protein HK100_006837, partial [Physocladia obscura]
MHFARQHTRNHRKKLGMSMHTARKPYQRRVPPRSNSAQGCVRSSSLSQEPPSPQRTPALRRCESFPVHQVASPFSREIDTFLAPTAIIMENFSKLLKESQQQQQQNSINSAVGLKMKIA